MNIKIKDGRDSLWQWDTGRKVEVEEPCNIVHFSNLKYGKALPVVVENGEAFIPDELLQIGGILFCYAFVGDVDDGYTLHEEQFEIERKPKPNDYFFTKTEYITLTDLSERLEVLEQSGGGGGSGKPGFSPTVEVAKTENGHKVSITDINGTKEFEVLNGKDGYTPQKGIDYFDGEKGDKGDSFTYEDFTAEQLEALKGKDGVDGKTPEKGVDYFTDADKEEIINAVITNVPAGMFIVDAVADFANHCLTGVSRSFAEIQAAYERNEHIVINANIEQLFPNGKATVPLVMIDDEKAAFSAVAYVDSAVNVFAVIQTKGTYLSINPLVGQEQISAINASLDYINGVVI